ncbi:MAG: GerW family sporulation protein [Chloroflexota bacterium]
MEKEEINAGPPITAGDVTVIPVIKTSIGCHGAGKGISASGLKRPTALVVVSSSGTKAFDISGEETSLDELIEAVPQLREMLQNT